MQVKRYEAVDMNEALRLIKEDLGPDAVILSSRKVTKGGGKFGVFGRPVVEVTAAVGSAAARPSARTQRAPQTAVAPARRETVGAGFGARPEEALLQATGLMDPVVEGIEELRLKLTELTADRGRSSAADRVADEVRELKSMMSYLIDAADLEKQKGMPRSYLTLARLLRDRGLAPEYVDTIVDELREKSGPHAPAPDVKTLVNVTAARMKGALTFGGDLVASPARRVVALVGPTGVGKTTTVAKLAAQLTMQGKSVALVTVDTYRIAAVEQLKIYAKILNIPLEVALQPADLARALHLHSHRDVVLIDTAGRSQRDTAQIAELKRFFDKAPQVEPQLCLSSASSEEQMEEAVKNFSPLNLTAMIFTKLDEAPRLGPVFNQSVRTGLPVSYFTTGQRVPEDVETAGAKRLIQGIFRSDRTTIQQESDYNG
jgi:flagellar biosynthesis protein FlhF